MEQDSQPVEDTRVDSVPETLPEVTNPPPAHLAIEDPPKPKNLTEAFDKLANEKPKASETQERAIATPVRTDLGLARLRSSQDAQVEASSLELSAPLENPSPVSCPPQSPHADHDPYGADSDLDIETWHEHNSFTLEWFTQSPETYWPGDDLYFGWSPSASTIGL